MRFAQVLIKIMAKATKKKNKLGVKNSLVNNINARKEKGVSRSKPESTVSKKSNEKMERNWKSKKK
jgi:hypothetical protein